MKIMDLIYTVIVGTLCGVVITIGVGVGVVFAVIVLLRKTGRLLHTCVHML